MENSQYNKRRITAILTILILTAGALVSVNTLPLTYAAHDGDTIEDGSDNCPDAPNEDQANADGDAFGDACDPFPNDPDNDVDGDGISGDVDNCPSVANADQANNDADTEGDACDTDDDNDGVLDDAPDNCQFTSNSDQTDADGDGVGDACDPVQNIQIDIKPRINCGKHRGVVPVVIRGSANFDATKVDITTLMLEGVEVNEKHGKTHGGEDMNGDSYLDIMIHLKRAEVCEALADPDLYPLKTPLEVTLTGMSDGEAFEGTDTIKIVKRLIL